ncbi:MAG: SGNH/GDSL hydrolase family protein [Pseudomonadota bacterium]
MKQWLIVAALGLAGCASGPSPQTDVLAIGDSILAWNSFSDRDIPSQVAQKTGLTVFNAAENGAEFFEAPTIPDQYEPGPWDWVIVDGGGNDLGKTCLRPAAAQAVLDALIAPDLSGAYADLLDQIRADGPRVIIMGYAPVSIRGGPFEGCAEVLDDLNDRQSALAAVLDGVFFVDARSVISPEDLEAYAIDRVHPTPLAGDLISDLIVEVLRR